MTTSRVDITKELCPMTWVRVKLAIEQLDAGARLEVLLRGEEPARNIPRNVIEDGHTIVERAEHPDGTLRLVIEVAHAE